MLCYFDCSFYAQSGFGDLRREIFAGEGGNYARIFGFDEGIDQLEVSPPVPPENFVPGTASIFTNLDTVILEGDELNWDFGSRSYSLKHFQSQNI